MRAPGLSITEDEAKLLAESINRVTELYDVPLLDEKSRAWLGLGMAGVEVYGTRIAAAMIDRKKKPTIVRPFEHAKQQAEGVIVGAQAQPMENGATHASES